MSAAGEAIRRILSGLVRAALVQDEEHARTGRSAALAAHANLLARGHLPDLAGIRLDGLWQAAVREAETPSLLGEALEVSPTLPRACPVRLDELVRPGLATAELEERIRGSASTG